MLSLDVHYRCKWDMCISVSYDDGIGIIDVADSNTVYYYHFDGLGSVIALSDQNADLVESCSYDVFGKPSNTSDVNNPTF